MSLFCENAKNEMIGEALRSRRQKLAFLSAYFRTAGVLGLNGGQKKLTVRCENPALKKRIKELLSEIYKDGAGQEEDKNSVTVSGAPLDRILADLKIMGPDGYEAGIHADLIPDTASEAAYLRGLFLGAGAVTLSKGYHLEFAFTNGFLASSAAAVLEKHGFTAKTVSRNDKTVVYMKDSGAISDMLAFLGAVKAVLELNGVSVTRDASRLTNRRLNCDMANIDKTVVSSTAQIEAIQVLEARDGLKKLEEKLRETARLRLLYPEASLNDLAEFSGVSKSGIRHRLNKLCALAKEPDETEVDGTGTKEKKN